MPIVLITGGSGFLGTYLTERFLADGHTVRILDVLPPEKVSTGVEFIRGDVRDSEIVAKASAGANVIVHNAALVPLSKSGDAFRDVNVRGTSVMLKAAIDAKINKFIFVSSSSVYGVPNNSDPITEETAQNPFEAYGISKAEAETLCQNAKDALDVSIIRPRTILGPGRMGLMSLLFDWVETNHRIYILGNGNNRYQLVAAEDVAEAVSLASRLPCRGQDFNVGADRFGTLREDLEQFCRAVGNKSKIVGVPSWLARATLPILGLLRLSPLVSYQYRIADKTVYFSTEKLKTILSFTPKYSNSEMLTRAYRWYKDHPTDPNSASLHRKKMNAGILRLLKYVP